MQQLLSLFVQPVFGLGANSEQKLSGKSQIFGGVILLLIGIEIFIQGF